MNHNECSRSNLVGPPHRSAAARICAVRALLYAAVVLWLNCASEAVPPVDSVRAEQSAKCERFAASLCTRQAMCVATGGNTTACVADAVGPQRFDCASVTSVSAGYDKCLGDISQSKCPLALPVSCKDVFGHGGTPQSAGDRDAAAGKGDAAGYFRCYVAGYYEVCDATGNNCERKFIDGFGGGTTRADAERMGLDFCNETMKDALNLNNIDGRAHIVAPCTIVQCDFISR
jgi:hypothetical protein